MLPDEKRIHTKQQLHDWLQYETGKYGAMPEWKKRLAFFELTENLILIKYMTLLRKCEYFINTKRRLRSLLYRVRLSRMQHRYGMHVPVNCCGRGLKIMHVGPVLISRRSTIGENCAIHFNTAVVAGGLDDSVPTIGDGVVVGIGAVVLGGVTVADHVAIGANAVVNKDVLEENVAVAGVPAKIISHNGALEWNKDAKKSR